MSDAIPTPTTTSVEPAAAGATGASPGLEAAAQVPGAGSGSGPGEGAPETALGGASTALPGGAGADPNAWAPEKHRVLKADGTLDVEATGRKVGEAYAALERKLGQGGQGQNQTTAPGDGVPAAGQDYSLAGLAEGTDVAALRADPGMQAFLQGARAQGITDRQASYVVGQYLQAAGERVAQTTAAVTAELREAWPEPGAFDTHMAHARRALDAYTPPDQRAGLLVALGNNPAAIRLLSRVGAELAEDRPAGTGGGTGVAALTTDAEAQALMADPAYRDIGHPGHAALQARITAYYARQAPRR